MKKSGFSPGARVVVSYPRDNDYSGEDFVKYYYDQYDETALLGTVINKQADDGCVWIKWDDFDEDEDEGQSEVNIDILTLESDLSKIEAEFKSYTKQIKEKMKEAASLIYEASDLADKARASSLADMYEEVSPLITAMDSSGWRSSSWDC